MQILKYDHMYEEKKYFYIFEMRDFVFYFLWILKNLMEFTVTHSVDWRGCHRGGAAVTDDFTKLTMLICHGKQN